MTDFIFYCLAAFMASVLTSLLWMRRGNAWSDSDYYALVQKYSDAASQLTSMKAELDKLQEQLEFSEDVRYTLGMENAKLANEIEGLKADVGKEAELRLKLIEMLVDSQVAKGVAEHGLHISQRSLRIARHKEFKRWKKSHRRNVGNWWPHTNPASYHDSIWTRRGFASLHDSAYVKSSIRESINTLRTMDPYPLP